MKRDRKRRKRTDGQDVKRGSEAKLERGSLKDVPRFMQHLYLEPCGYCLVITVLEVNGVLWILHNPIGGFRLMFVVRKQHHERLEKVISGLIDKGAFRAEGAVSVPMPEMWLEAAEKVEEVIRGYGASENTRLFFHFGFLFGGTTDFYEPLKRRKAKE